MATTGSPSLFVLKMYNGNKMKDKITLQKKVNFDDLTDRLRRIIFRGLYNKKNENLKPYKKAKFSQAKVFPAKAMGQSPIIITNNSEQILFSPQPTIYQNQTEIIKIVDKFLTKEKMRVNQLKGAIEYEWEGRGVFHMLPPIIEKHTYYLKNGFIDLSKLSQRFKNFYVKDANDNLHHLADRYLNNYFIDEVSSIHSLDVFHSNAPIINYGIQHTGYFDFYIICDGMHRIDYSIEHLNEPIDVLLVESGETPLIPYYAFPVPFHPTVRLSSKQSEKMYPRLERDKIHLLNDFLKKTLHYDWTPADLNVSKLRTNIG